MLVSETLLAGCAGLFGAAFVAATILPAQSELLLGAMLTSQRFETSLLLTRAGVPAIAQTLLSGSIFAAIHLGYAGETACEFLSPLIGTFMLGCFYAWAVQSGRGSLKPVICCHILIIVMLQPWLALAR